MYCKIENSTLNAPLALGDGNTVIIQNSNNEKELNKLDGIIKDIIENLSDLDEDDAEELRDVVGMAKEELGKNEPKEGRLRNCLNLITPMITIANGIPVLVCNLQKLKDYILFYINGKI